MYPEDAGIRLVCPDCRAGLVREREAYLCTGAACRRGFPIVDGIPKLLAGCEAALEMSEWNTRIAAARAAIGH